MEEVMDKFELGYQHGKRDAELMPSIWWNFHLWTPVGMIVGAILTLLVSAATSLGEDLTMSSNGGSPPWVFRCRAASNATPTPIPVNEELTLTIRAIPCEEFEFNPVWIRQLVEAVKEGAKDERR